MATDRTLREAALAPVSLASLAAFRVFFGAIACGCALRRLAYGWVEDFFVTPRFWFPFIEADWCRPLPAPWMQAVFWLQALAAFSLCLGWWSRTSAFVFLVAFTWPELLDKTNYLNHHYLVSLLALLLVVVPAGRLFSMDSRLDPSFRRSHGPAWILWLMRLQVGVVYFFAGVGKLNSDWLLHAQPLRIWLATAADLPVIGPLLALPAMPWLMSWGGALFDLAVPFALLAARTRPLAFVCLLTFHLVTRAMFPLGIFPWLMLAAVTLFFPPTWPERWIGRQTQPKHLQPGRPWLVLAAAFALWQSVIPLRRFAIPGDWLWHEQGFRFAWNVMLVEKSGDARFILKNRQTGEETEVRNRDWLTRVQEHMMSTQPDMILQFARHLATIHPHCEIRADVWVSWNGRTAARLIDPTVDLSRLQDVLSICLTPPTP